MSAQTPDARDAVDAGPISRLAAVWMVLVGVFAFSALAVLISFAPDLANGDNGRAHALSRSAIGYGALVRALKLSGHMVVISRGPLSAGAGGLIVVTDDFPSTTGKPLTVNPGRRTMLMVLPKWVVLADPHHPGWVDRLTLIDPRLLPKGDDMTDAQVVRRTGVSRPVLSGAAAPFAGLAPLNEGPTDSFQTIGNTRWIPILTDDRGGVVLAQIPGQATYILSDPDLLDTQGLKAFDTLASALTLIDRLGGGRGPVIFDVTLHGFARQRGLSRLMFAPPFLGVTLCLAAAAALAGFQAFCRFGPIRRQPRAIALGKAAMVDNAAALIRLARRETKMGGRYAALTRALAARALGAPRELDGDDLTGLLDRLGAQRGATDSLADLSAQAERTRDRDRLTAIAQKLYHWRLEMTRERR